jgi:hypothetical protein
MMKEMPDRFSVPISIIPGTFSEEET